MAIAGLNDLEQAVMDKLLDGDHPLLAALRGQAKRARVSSHECSSAGFLCSFELPAESAPLPGAANFELDDVDAAIDGLEHGAGFLLFVRDGRLAALEGYSYEEPWPTGAAIFRLSYRQEPRDLKV
jgi:hypothetical protein